MNRLWAQIVVVCWAAVLIWLVAFELFPSRGPVVRSVDNTRTLAPVATGDAAEATPTPTLGPSESADGTAEPCRNSYEPSCGQFRWDPPPKNRPMDVDAEVTSGTPNAGEQVKVAIVARDDTTIVEAHGGQWGDGSPPFGGQSRCDATTPGPARYGPWAPPEAEDDTYEFEVAHTYEKAGTYEFVVQLMSGDGCEGDSRYPNPYGEPGQAKLRLVVTD